MTKITALPLDSAPQPEDYIPTIDVTDTTTKKALLSSLTPMYNPYKFKAYMGSTQNLSATTFTKLNMNTESFDTNNNFSTSTYFYTVPVNGFYYFFGAAQLLSQAGSVYLIGISKDGTTEFRRFGEIPNTTGNIQLIGSILEQFTAGETLCLYAYTGTAKTINSGVALSYFGGYLVSRT